MINSLSKKIQKSITNNYLKENFKNGISIKNKIINDDLNLHKLKYITKETDFNFSFENCIFNKIDFSFHTFLNRVKFKNCIVEDLYSMSSYYELGFEMINCNVIGNLNLRGGIHNKFDSFILENTIINGFSNFEDSLFINKVSIRNNNFVNGTNLLGKSILGTEVEFQNGYCIENNLGNIRIEHGFEI